MQKNYLIDINSVLEFQKSINKKKKFEIQPNKINFIDKLKSVAEFNFRNSEIADETYILFIDGINEQKISELANEYIITEFSGTIFKAKDHLKRYLRKSEENVKTILISNDFELCNLAIENKITFIKVDEFILKLEFFDFSEDKNNKNSLLNNFEENNLKDVKQNLKNVQKNVESETFNLLNYFENNSLNLEIEEIIKDSNLKKIPNHKDLIKNRNENFQNPNYDNSQKLKENTKSIESKNIESKSTNKDNLDRLNRINSKDDISKIDIRKVIDIRKDIDNRLINGNIMNDDNNKKQFNDLSDLSNLLTDSEKKELQIKEKQKQKEQKKYEHQSIKVENNNKRINDETKSEDFDFFLNKFSK